jgi:LDH2 family malate/lactate/ureidoglycolate dehydrogenase
VEHDEGVRRLQTIGFDHGDAEALWAHFDNAEKRGKLGHGHSRIEWLEAQKGSFDPTAYPLLLEKNEMFSRWNGNGAIGYITLITAVHWEIDEPPDNGRLVVIERCFPTGMLGHYARMLAEAGFVSVLTATSPARLGHPDGGPKLAGTNPLAIGIPSSRTEPIVVDVSMGAVTWGDVLAGLATEEELVPFGGESAHKAFALALGLQLLVDSLVRHAGHGVVMLVARPESDPVPLLREVARGVRLPGDS